MKKRELLSDTAREPREGGAGAHQREREQLLEDRVQQKLVIHVLTLEAAELHAV